MSLRYWGYSSIHRQQPCSPAVFVLVRNTKNKVDKCIRQKVTIRARKEQKGQSEHERTWELGVILAEVFLVS